MKSGEPEDRAYQTRAVDELALASKTHRRIVFVAPTGAGKTRCASLMANRMLARGMKLLFLAHRRELINQAYDTLRWGGVQADRMSIIRAGDPRYNPHAPVQVASVLSLVNLPVQPLADVIFVDEGHRVGAETYRQILSWYPNALVILLTATPVRGKRGLKGLADAMVIAAKPSELIDSGFIVAPEVLTIRSDLIPDTSKVKTERTGDYNVKQLAALVNKPHLVGSVVDHYREHGGGQRALCFCVDVAHSRAMCEAFNAAGVPAAHVDGATKEEDRALAFDRLESGEISVLCNVDICTEGFDMPSVRVCIMARPTQSLVVFLQQAGRVSRPYGSEPALLLDHVGNVQYRFGLPDDDREWKLDSEPERTMGVKTCPRCFRVVRATTRYCPGTPAAGDAPATPCGYEWTRESTERAAIEQIEGRLARVERASKPVSEQELEWRALCRTALKNGYKENWARMQWKERFGAWPEPSKYVFPERPQSRYDDVRRRREYDRLRASAFAIGQTVAWAEDKYATLFGEPVTALLGREARRASGQGESAATGEKRETPEAWELEL